VRDIAANRTLAEIYGYETPTALIVALTDIAEPL
jgi:hypothetical protein